jgi:hypothetical protein
VNAAHKLPGSEKGAQAAGPLRGAQLA